MMGVTWALLLPMHVISALYVLLVEAACGVPGMVPHSTLVSVGLQLPAFPCVPSLVCDLVHLVCTVLDKEAPI